MELSDDTAGDSDGGPANANVVPTIVRDALPTLGRSDSPSNSNSDSLSTGSRPNSARRGSGFSNADILDIARVASRSPGMPRSAFSEVGCCAASSFWVLRNEKLVSLTPAPPNRLAAAG